MVPLQKEIDLQAVRHDCLRMRYRFNYAECIMKTFTDVVKLNGCARMQVNPIRVRATVCVSQTHFNVGIIKLKNCH